MKGIQEATDDSAACLQQDENRKPFDHCETSIENYRDKILRYDFYMDALRTVVDLIVCSKMIDEASQISCRRVHRRGNP